MPQNPTLHAKVGPINNEQRNPCAEMGYKVGPRLRELASAARGSQEEVGFTQPTDYVVAHICMCGVCWNQK